MIRAWISGLAAHSLLGVVFAAAAVVEAFGRAPAWLPDDFVRWAALHFVLGPIAAFVIAGAGPRGRADFPLDLRIARRVMGVAVLVLVVPLGLLTAALIDVAVGGTIALGAAALLMLLSPWMALYVRWFSEA
jgi:tryptophan-rich sensory protein